jgi:hypothetical protein
VAEPLAAGDNEEAAKTGQGPWACGEGVLDADGVENVGGVRVRQREFTVFVIGETVEGLAVGFVG